MWLMACVCVRVPGDVRSVLFDSMSWRLDWKEKNFRRLLTSTVCGKSDVLAAAPRPIQLFSC